MKKINIKRLLIWSSSAIALPIIIISGLAFAYPQQVNNIMNDYGTFFTQREKKPNFVRDLREFRDETINLCDKIRQAKFDAQSRFDREDLEDLLDECEDAVEDSRDLERWINTFRRS